MKRVACWCALIVSVLAVAGSASSCGGDSTEPAVERPGSQKPDRTSEPSADRDDRAGRPATAANSPSPSVSDDYDGGPAQGATKHSDQKNVVPAVRTLFNDMRRAIASKDARGACQLLSRAARQAFTSLASSADASCEAGFERLLSSGLSESEHAVVVRIETNGPKRATLYARQPNRDKTQHADFVVERGEWKVNTWLTD